MAPIRDFGRPENDEGEWVPFGEDAPFRLRIRRIPYEIGRQIDLRYGREIVVQGGDGIRRPQLERSRDEWLQAMLDKAAFALVDSEGLEVEVADAEARGFYAAAFKDDSITVGATVVLDGHLRNDAVKKRLFTTLRPFARVKSEEEPGKIVSVDIGSFIMSEADRIGRSSAQKREVDLKK